MTRKVAGTAYLKYTIQSLINETSAEEKETTVVLILAADFEDSKRAKIVDLISKEYSEHLVSGFIQIMQVAQSAYPKMDGLKRNYNDPEPRVKWRSKQAADFAFMFNYGRKLSKYYIQLEDDVKSTPKFIANINSFIDKQNKEAPNWAVLGFCELGFIGKLFKSVDLQRFAQYLLMFYYEMPVDWLVEHFQQIMAQKKQIIRRPTLFQHMGEFSSFASKGKTKLKDRHYAGGKVPSILIEAPVSSNPPAEVCTTIQHYEDYLPIHGYNDGSDSFFWGKRPKANDTFTVSLTKPKKIQRLYIETGHSRQQNDFIRNGYVQVSATSAGKCACKSFTRIGYFSEGKFVHDKLDELIKFPVKCIQIVISKEQEEWVIISEITPS